MDANNTEKPDEFRALLDDPLFDSIARRVNRRLGLGYTPRGRLRLARRVLERLRAESGLTLKRYDLNLRLHEEEWSQLWLGLTDERRTFFQHPAQYELLADFADEWALKGEERQLRVVALGCGRGHDLYSLAMALKVGGLAAKGWQVDFYGLDINPKAVEAAQAALYDGEELAVLEPGLARKWFEPRAGRWRFRRDVMSLKGLAAGLSYDFSDWPWPELAGGVKIIWARGLAGELSPPAVRALIQTAGRLLAPGGLLFASPGEAWPGLAGELRPELREGQIYFRRPEDVKLKANPRSGGRKNRRAGSSGRQRPQPPRPEPGFRIKGLLRAAAEKLALASAFQAEEAQDIILEALDEAESGRLFVPEAWALAALKEELLGRPEAAAATAVLSATMAPWATYPLLTAERLLTAQGRPAEALALKARIEADRNELKEASWPTNWAEEVFSPLGY